MDEEIEAPLDSLEAAGEDEAEAALGDGASSGKTVHGGEQSSG